MDSNLSLKKRNDIIASAQELFSKRGISEVSITEIAEKSHVSRVTLFKYFGDKESLAREVVHNWFKNIIFEYETILSSDDIVPKKLIDVLNIRINKREKLGENFISQMAWGDKGVQKLFEEISMKYAVPQILKLIKEGKSTGYIDESIDDEAILAYFSAMGFIIKNPQYIKKDENFQKSIYNLFLGGLIKGWDEINLKI